MATLLAGSEFPRAVWPHTLHIVCSFFPLTLLSNPLPSTLPVNRVQCSCILRKGRFIHESCWHIFIINYNGNALFVLEVHLGLTQNEFCQLTLMSLLFGTSYFILLSSMLCSSYIVQHELWCIWMMLILLTLEFWWK